MNIKNISLIKTKTTVRLEADIYFDKQKKETLFFIVDKQYKDFLVKDASPFLAAMLLPCMKKKENITIEGNVSAKLLAGIEHIMNIFVSWNIGFYPVAVSATNITKDTYAASSIASFFSGGVDSFYTFLKHKKKNNSKISHLVLVKGFDIPLANTSFFNEVKKEYEQMAKKENVKLITVQTNAGELIESRILWDYGHGAALAAVGLLLRAKLQKLFIPASVSKEQVFPYGSHPDVDKYWSTETLQIIHDGIESSRLEKVVNSIAKSPLALQHLRVCCQNRKGKYNCSRCFKCLRTMMELICADALELCATFEKKISYKLVENLYFDSHASYDVTANIILSYLKKTHKNTCLQKALEKALKKSKKFSLARTISRFIAYIDQTYNQRRLYTYIFSMNKSQDRNIYFKLLQQVGVIR